MISRLLFLIALSGLSYPNAQVSDRARELHEEALVFDAHVHMINRQFYLGGDIGDRFPDGQVDLPRLREGGVDAFFFTLFVSEQYYPARYETKHTLRLIDLALMQIEKNSHVIELALTGSDIERISKKGKIAAVLDLEGGFDLDGDLGVLRALYRLGLRVVQLPAHNWANEFADSCCAPHKWGGLNQHGREVIGEMNRLGMIINVSHASDETLEQAIELSSDPIVATHHGLRSFNNIARVMPERLLKKLASKGGLIGFQIGHSFHSPRYHAWRTQQAGRPFWDTSRIGAKEAKMPIFEIDKMLAPRYPSVGPTPPEDVLMSVDEWLNVVDRATKLVGEDHVALGTDFDGGPTPPRGMRDIRDLSMITDAMLRRGYSEERIRKFLGANLLRVFSQVTEQ
ncbi:dipeptidase [Acidobacteria bacterium AH-259-O06]|nr:dipeptidase [Acidobacteria bacterium AH-259-O06]